MNALVAPLRALRDTLARLFFRGRTPAQDRKARRQQTDQRMRHDAHRQRIEDGPK